MKENFELLLPRVIDTLKVSDLKRIKNELNSIKGNTIIIGAGGSSVVADFASKVINRDFLNICMSSRDLNYSNIDLFDNILVISYSGRGYVVESAINKNKKVYLLTNSDNKYNNVNVIKYESKIKRENSFISLASTLMPISILLNYYNQIDIKEIEKIFNKVSTDIISGKTSINKNNIYEIMGGKEYSSSMKYLETTMVESGIAIPIIHDKYDYCHGRSTISYINNNGLIYFDNNKELDKLMLKELKKYYEEIIIIEKYNKSNLINDYYGIIKSMYLTKLLATNKNKNLSKVDHSPLVYKLYNYRGEM